MGKRNKPDTQSSVVSKPESSSSNNFVPLVGKQDVPYNNKVNIQCCIDSNFRYQSKTGEWYEWRGAGSVVAVRSDEAEVFLNMRFGGMGCCGQQSQSRLRIFRLEGV